MSLMDNPVWVTDQAKNTCESCGRVTTGHEVLFGDGTRFVVCSGCAPAVVPIQREP